MFVGNGKSAPQVGWGLAAQLATQFAGGDGCTVCSPAADAPTTSEVTSRVDVRRDSRLVRARGPEEIAKEEISILVNSLANICQILNTKRYMD